MISMIDLRQSSHYKQYMESIGWKVEIADNCQVFIKKIPLGLGSFIKILRPSPPIPFKEIDKVAKRHRAWFVKLEPNITDHDPRSTIHDLKINGFRPSSWPLAPSKTLQINLAQPRETLFKQCEKRARNAIRKAVREGVVVVQSKDIEQFCSAWVKSMRRKGSLLATGGQIKDIWQAFSKNAHLLLANQLTNKTRLLAGALVITYDRIAHYMFATSTKEGNRFGAPSVVVWKAMLLAKKLGCRIFDLEGIYDPRYHQATKSWRGFSRFKKGFGGEEITYIGSFIKTYTLLGKLVILLSR